MDTLQIQDAFAPYYADQPSDIQADPARQSEAARDIGEMRKRLERCRARLAQTLASERGAR